MLAPEYLVLLVVSVVPLALLLFFLGTRRQLREQHQQLVEVMERQQASLADAREASRSAAEASVSQPPVPEPVSAPAPMPEPKDKPKISEDKLMVIGAVLACHFGKRVKVRSARRIMVGSGSNVWSQQGRAAVQAMRSGFR